ncbi:MAG: hypothetical protein QF464_05995, partial [Myxococcota bacterium]|nr:hypothetical protein [Myxococcota bacterium]
MARIDRRGVSEPAARRILLATGRELGHDRSMVRVDEIEAAQQAWADGVVAVGATGSWQEAHALATAFVTRAYAIEDQALLFCPTRARQSQFRSTL